MQKLSPAMRAAMRKLTRYGHSAYELQVEPRTLWALYLRGLADGACVFPCTLIEWRLTERGEQWLKAV